ncbi:MAG: ABC transporter permease [Bacteroidales bacterium]|nr:ABC transporter permease [Bacteroidales bacterium]
MERFYHTLNIAIDAVLANKFRSILTALGIIFGVAAVIAMMAIGNGARQEILDQIKMVGVNNIQITPILDNSAADSENDEDNKNIKGKYSPGLTLEDAKSIHEIIPTVLRISPEVTYETYIIKDGIRKKATLKGVSPDFFEVYSLPLQEGEMFNEYQMQQGSPVCIIGPTIKSRFFPAEDPLGKYIKCGNIWLKVVGILESMKMATGTSEDLGISDYNNNIYAPLQTVLLRYKDRSVIDRRDIGGGGTEVVFMGGAMMTSSFSSSSDEETNKNQLDKIVVQVDDSENLNVTTGLLNRMLLRRHSDIVDFEITVPELLLKQEQRTKDIFNIVLGVIASISLIVGGIGIMNIMLASVMERIREIGVRRATGATRRDIITQFLTEATLISVTGGFLGIVLGVVFAKLITEFTGILTIISLLSIVVSFGVSAAIGIMFGYMPARRAANQNPVESLRYE